MENTPQLSMHFLNLSENKRNILNEINLACNSNLIINSSDIEIRKSIGYGLILLGIPKDKYPVNEIEKIIIINFIKKSFSSLKLNEINLAFDYAVEKRINVELSTYGAVVSANFISNILYEYIKLKMIIINENTKKDFQLNNYQRASGIVKLLKEHVPEFYDKLKNNEIIDKPKIERKQSNEDKLIQEFLKDFDKLHKEQGNNNGSIRFVEYNGKKLNQEKYCQIKLKEFFGDEIR